MADVRSIRRVLAWAAVWLACGAWSLADLPTSEEIVARQRDNAARLNPLHVRMTYTYEATDAQLAADRKTNAREAEILKTLEAAVESGAVKLTDPVQPAELQMTIGDVLAQMREDARMGLHAGQRLAHYQEPLELFLSGEDYQVRLPLQDLTDFTPVAFPEEPITPDSLATAYRDFQIYSWSHRLSPPALRWTGPGRKGSRSFAAVSAQHAAATGTWKLPAFVSGGRASWGNEHPLDAHFTRRMGEYRVVRDDVWEGRPVVVADADIDTGTQSSFANDKGEHETRQVIHHHRVWLDLERGGLPLRIEVRYKIPDAEGEAAVRYAPKRTVAATEIVQLEGGGYYPKATTEETWERDPTAPELTDAEWDEVRAGKREGPAKVVFERKAWTCDLVEAHAPQDPAFYILQFPPDQPIFDQDAGKLVGAVDLGAAVRPGDAPPPLQVARWLDGQSRSLDDLSGRVVVLGFWSLTAGGVREAVPLLKRLQEKYRDQPVTFISIHSADGDSDQLAERVRAFAAAEDWHWTAAIDAGTMPVNSLTTCAYGIRGSTTEVILGRDGRVVYNSQNLPPELEAIPDEPWDQPTPDDEAKLEAYMRQLAVAAGEEWPLDDLPEAEQQAAWERVELYHLCQRIDAALQPPAATK